MYVRIAVLAVSLSLTACTSGSAPDTPNAPSAPQTNPPPTPVPGGPPTVTVTATGVSPKELTVVIGARVTFANADTRPHDILGGIDHVNRECPEIDAAGFLVPGQTRQTDPLTTPRTCAFHDHSNLGVPAFQGRIIIQ